MDAKPLRTHFKSFKSFRTFGTILCIFGGSVCSISISMIIFGVLMRVLFPSSFPQYAEFLLFSNDYNVLFIVYGVSISFLAMQVFAAGLILLAFSTGSKIKDANRGIEYDKLRSF